MKKPLAIDLYCGLGGWTEGLLAEGWDVIGFDIERHQYGDEKYPGQLVLQDVRTLDGAQFKDAALIVGSSPCQEFSYRAMPWKRAKALGPPLLGMELFNAQFRIQREACAALGGHVPMICENVKGAQPWVGRAQWHFGSFYLWGDIPALMPIPQKRGVKIVGQNWSNFASPGEVTPHWRMQAIDEGQKVGDQNEFRRSGQPSPHFTNPHERGCRCTKVCDCQNPDPENGTALVSNECPVHNFHPEPNPECPVHTEKDSAADRLQRKLDDSTEGVKLNLSGHAWFRDGLGSTRSGSKARKARKAASAKIAKIPLPLSQHIARVFKPREGSA